MCLLDRLLVARSIAELGRSSKLLSSAAVEYALVGGWSVFELDSLGGNCAPGRHYLCQFDWPPLA